jgi:hypothetical protein
MYGYCVYPAKSKGPKQLPNCLKISETSVVLSVFKEASSVTSALTLLPFLYVAKQESSTRKVILWSVTVYSKQLSSQCNLTAQIEPVRDKYIYLTGVRHGQIDRFSYLRTKNTSQPSVVNRKSNDLRPFVKRRSDYETTHVYMCL